MKITITVELDGEYTELTRVGDRPDLARLLRECVLRLADQYEGERMTRLADAVAGVDLP